MDFIAVLANNLQLDVLGVFSHVDDLAGQEAGSVSPLKMATSSGVVVTDRMAPIGWTLEKAGPEVRIQLISSAGARLLSPRTPYPVWLESLAGPRGLLVQWEKSGIFH